MPDAEQNTNVAPYPDGLADLVQKLEYRPGWEFYLEHIDRGQGSEGLTFRVVSQGYDTYHPDRGETYRVNHYMIVPAASFDRRAWQRWILEQLLLIEQHEAAEFMQIDGVRPFAPNHGPGRDPYQLLEVGRVEDAETRFTGQHLPGSQAGRLQGMA